MIADQQDAHELFALGADLIAERRRTPDVAIAYRSKEDLEPVITLPRWTRWALVVWTLASAAAYTVILARWWE